MKAFKRRRLVFGFLFGVLAALAATPANAGTYYWDTNGSTSGAGPTPTGTWGSNAFWNTNSTGGSGTFITTSGSADNLNFVASAGTSSGENSYTVTVFSNQNANSLTFASSGAATLSGGTISLWGGGITVSQYAYGATPQGPVTISSPISLQSSQMWVNNASSNLTISGSVINGGNTLTIAGPGNTTVSAIIGSGSGGLTKTGLGTVTLTAANTFTGGTTISNGILQIGDGTSGHDGTLSATGGISDSTALVYDLFGSQTYAGIIGGIGSVTKIGAGSLTLSGSNTYSGGTAIGGGTLVVTNTGALPRYNSLAKVTVGNGGTLTLTGWTPANISALLAANGVGFASGSALGIDTTSGGMSYTNAIAGSMGLTKLGPNTLTLSGTNSFTGLTTISGGVLDLSSTSALQGSTLVAPSAGGSMVFDQSASGTGFSLGGLSGSGNIALQNNATVAVALTVGANNSSTTYFGTLSGTGASLTKTGTGTLSLAGPNSYTGTTTVSGGILAVTTTSALPGYGSTSRVAVGNGGTLALTAGTSGSTWTQTVIGNLLSANGSGFAAGSALGIDTSIGNFSYGGSLAGSMGLTKLGSNMLTLTTSNSFTGQTTVAAGTLDLANSAALQASTLLAPTAGSIVFDQGVGSHAFTLGGLGGYGGIVLQNGASSPAAVALTVGGNGSSTAYYGVLSGSGSLTKTGLDTLTLTAANTFIGGTTIRNGTLQFGNGLIGDDGSVVATGGIIDNAILSYNLYGPQTYSGVISGSGSLTKAGNGTLTLMGTNTFSGGITVNAGALTVASNGSISMTTGSTGKYLYLGNGGPAAMTVQDNASVNVGGELDVNYGTTQGGPSILTINSGSPSALTVAGATFIGRANMSADPSNTSAAVYQSSGGASLSGPVTVGNAGTATSLYDIDGGTLNANAGLQAGYQGNGVVNIHGSGIVTVTGSQGLVIGQDSSLATAGSVSLSSGTLTVGTQSVKGNVTFGSSAGKYMGIGTLSRTGGAMAVSGNLIIDGDATLILDDTSGSVATSFGGKLTHGGAGTLVVVPQHGDMDASTDGWEALSVGTNPAPSGGIVGPWAVRQVSGSNSSGDYLGILAVSSSSYRLVTATYSGTLQTAGSSAVVNVAANTSLTQNVSVSAVKFGPYTTTISGSGELTLVSGGMILNGGTLTGGTVACKDGIVPLVYAGSSSPSKIGSSLISDSGLVKFGEGELILSGSNSGLTGQVVVSAGTLNVQSGFALGHGVQASPVTVAAGASLEIQGNTALNNNVPITLNGTGAGGGSLCNLQDNNSLGSTISLSSNSQINVAAGSLALTGNLQGGYNLTKTGSGSLVLAGASGTAFPTLVTVAGGVLQVQNAAGLGPGYGLGAAVNSGATLQLQGGIAIPGVPLTLNGAGTSGSNGSLENLQGSNSWAGPVALAADSQVNIDAAADSLTVSGNINGDFALTKGGAGTLVLSGSNGFYGALNVLSGTLNVASVNAANTVGPLGEGTAPVSLGGNGTTGTFLYTGTGASTNRAFTMGAGTLAGSGGVFQIGSSLALNGAIDGNGSLTMTGSGTLTLGGSNLYTGATTVSAGTLAVGPSGSINASSDLFISQGGLLQVTAGTTGSQLPNAGNITISGGTLNYAANGSLSAGDSVGALVLNPGHSQFVLSNAGSGTPYLCFAAGTPHLTGATAGFSASGAQVEFLYNPPSLVNGILPYAFYGPANSTTVDFAQLSTTGGVTLMSALTYSSSTMGSISTMGSNSTLNLAATGSQSSLTFADTFNSLKLASASSLSMTGAGSLILDSGGLICTGSSCTISGGTISAPAGELIIDTATNLNISSALSASAALTKTGTATLTLSSTSPILGNTFINQGTLAYALSANLNYAQAISGVGNLLISGTGAMLTLGGSDTYTGSTNVTAGTLCVNGSLAGGGPVSLQSGATLSGSGSIAGNVAINSGTITVGQQGSGTYLKIGGGLSVGGAGSFAASGTAAAISGNLNYTSSANSTYSGTILGPASTVTLNSPPGTILNLSGSNQYGGGTTVLGGTLKVSNSAALADGDLSITGGTKSALDLDGLSALEVAALSGNGIITKSSSGTCTLTVSPESGSTPYFSGTITNGNGKVALVLADSTGGGLILAGSNSYTGGTTVLDGTLDVYSANALPTGTSLAVGSGGTVVFGAEETMLTENISAEEVLAPLAGSAASPAPDTSVSSGSTVTPVPEPGGAVLLLAALVALGLRRCFKSGPVALASGLRASQY